MPVNKNASLLRTLLTEAEFLARSVSKEKFPVPLRSIAERRRVTSVEFRPLLVDAMLTTHPNGFRILFNSNGADAVELRNRYQDENPEKLLPSRLRFSLAHELAHTFFYDLSKNRPQVVKQFRAGGKKTALDNLERNCNRIAGRLLVPTKMLKVAFNNRKSFCPELVFNLSKRAGVSAETLVRRLDETTSPFLEQSFYGCVVLVERSHGEMTIAAVAKPKNMNIARELLLLRSGERWQLKSRDGFEIDPATASSVSSVNLTVETSRSTSLRQYQMLTKNIGRFDSVERYLITFEELRN